MYTGTNLSSKEYYHTDHQGSTLAMSNNGGTLSDSYRYSAFGEPGIEGPAGNPFRYTGRRLDAETGLFYYRARYYSPTMGRFLQTDPIGYGDNMNMYAYVGNDPTNATDPTGEKTCKSPSCQRKMFEELGLDPELIDDARATHSEFVNSVIFSGVPISGGTTLLSKLGISSARLKAAGYMPRIFGLSNSKARQVYKTLLSKIPGSIDKTKSLSNQARQAHRLRNEARTYTRSVMKDRRLAGKLDKTDPNLSFDDQVKAIMKKHGYDNVDDAYKHMLESAARSRSAVDEALGL